MSCWERTAGCTDEALLDASRTTGLKKPKKLNDIMSHAYLQATRTLTLAPCTPLTMCTSTFQNDSTPFPRRRAHLHPMKAAERLNATIVQNGTLPSNCPPTALQLPFEHQLSRSTQPPSTMSDYESPDSHIAWENVFLAPNESPERTLVQLMRDKRSFRDDKHSTRSQGVDQL